MTTLRTIRTELARNITVYLKTYNCRKEQCRKYHDARASFVCQVPRVPSLLLVIHGNDRSSQPVKATKQKPNSLEPHMTEACWSKGAEIVFQISMISIYLLVGPKKKSWNLVDSLLAYFKDYEVVSRVQHNFIQSMFINGLWFEDC